MKKIFYILISSMLIGCTNVQSRIGYIGEEAAKNIAIKDAGGVISDAIFERVELDNEAGVEYYEIDFSLGNISYDYDIDAYTGKIISKSSENNTESTAKPSNQPQATPATSSVISETEAKSIALKHANLKESDVTFISVKLESDDGITKYDVEFYSKDKKEYDYEINAYTKEIVSYDYDVEGYEVNTVNTNGAVISESEAKNIALKQVAGASVNDIYEFEVDYDDGKVEYEGKIIYNNVEYEFSIDGYSGAIRSWEVENY